MSNILITGSTMQDIDDCESSSDDEFNVENDSIDIHITDDEEELETFDRQFSTIKSNISKNDTNIKSQEPQQSSVNTVSTNNEIADDTFGIAYKPFKLVNNDQYSTQYKPHFEDEENVLIKLTTSDNSKPADDDDAEFDFSSSQDEQSNALLNSLERLANKDLSKTTEEYVSNDENSSLQATTSDVNALITETNEETINESNVVFDVKQAAQRALDDLVQIYSSGLGDVEARLQTDNVTADFTNKKFHALPNKNALSISEVIEEGDEDGELEEELREIETTLNINNEQKRLEMEWNLVSDTESHSTSNSLNNIVTDTALDTILVSYDDLLKYFNTVDLSLHKDSIIVDEKPKDSSSSWGGKVMSILGSTVPLKLSNSQHLLEFPFLLAQVDYDSSNSYYFGALRCIYSKLIDSQGIGISCPSIGQHWESIGFQGINPVTDLNRSMKMFAVLQVLHLVDKDFAFAKSLHSLSGSLILSTDTTKLKGSVDNSWPFMCVSIMFTKESIQALRRGDLNKKCNKRQDILSVVHDFHHACFYDFAKRLLSSTSSKILHHAEYLKQVRDLCLSNPSQLMRNYRNAVKTRSDISNDLIGYINKSSKPNPVEESINLSKNAVKPNRDVLTTQTKMAEAVNEDKILNFDTLDDEIIDDVDDSSGHASGFWTSLGLNNSKADKFKV